MTTKAKWPRISGGKSVEKWTLDTDAGTVECQSYRIRNRHEPADSTWACVARLGDAFVTEHAEGRWGDEPESLDDLEERFRKLIRDRVGIEWRPHLFVTVTSSRLVHPNNKQPVFRDGESLRNSRSADLSFCIDIRRMELGTTGSGKKKRRGGNTGYSGDDVVSSWPDVGPSGGLHGTPDNMRALIPDTAENRGAVDAMRKGMQRLNEQLRRALSPEHIEMAFANIHHLLPAPAAGEDES